MMFKSILSPVMGLLITIYNFFVPTSAPAVEMQTVVIATEVSNPTTEEMESAEKLIRTRLDSLGYTQASVSFQSDTQLEIAFPKNADREQVVNLLTAKGELLFLDSASSVILDDSHIVSAKPQYNELSETGSNVHYVELTLSTEGQKLFADATERISKQTDGNNYISITLDGTVISAPFVMERIDSKAVIISGDFDADATKTLAALIASGKLPFAFTVVV